MGNGKSDGWSVMCWREDGRLNKEMSGEWEE